MSQRALALAAVLILAAAPAFAADPGARAAITVGAAINDVALAWDSGTLGIVTQDPTGRLTVPPGASAAVWYMYSPDGRNLLQDGDADIDACDNASATFDDCQTHATLVGMSKDGTRMVVASTADDGNPVLTFVRDTSGPLAAVRNAAGTASMQGTVQDLAISDDGQTVAVIANLGQTANPRGRLYVFNWAAGSSTSPNFLWSDTFPLATSDLAMSPDGQTLAVTEDTDHHRYKRSGVGTQVTDTNFSGTGMDVALANGGRHLSVAGSSQGWFIFYTEDTPAGGRETRIRDAEVSLDAVDIRADATAIALGNAAGDLWVYGVDPAILKTTLVGKVSLGSPVRELAFARDGLSVAVAHGNEVSHYAVEATGLVKLWTAALTNSAGDVAIDEHGDRVAAATGSQAIVYEAKHRVNITVPVLPPATPGQTVSTVLTYANTGNRVEAASLSVQPPTGWTATLDKSQLRLNPDGTGTVRVNVTVPASEVPGTKEVRVTSAMGAAGSPTTTLAYNVPAIEAWAIAAQGASSVSVQSGGSNSFVVDITNKGNVAKEPPVSVAASPAGWTATLAGHTGILAGGAEREAIVTLSAPAGTAQLAQGTATVTLHNAQGSPLVLTGTVGASFNVDLGGDDAVQATPGSPARITLKAKNTGNAPDTFTAEVGALPTGWTAAFPHGASVALGPGSTGEIALDITVPAGAGPMAPVEITATARSAGDASKSDIHSFLVSLPGGGGSETSDSDTKTKSKGSPGMSFLSVLAVVAVAALASRRHGKGPH